MFLYSPAYLSEHVGHVHSTAVGVINGMMQHSWLLRLRPPIYTHIHTLPHPFSLLFVFLDELCSDLSNAAMFLTLHSKK